MHMLFPMRCDITLWCKIQSQVGFSGCRNWDGDSCVSASLRDSSKEKGSEGSRVGLEKEGSKESVSAEDLLQSDPTGTMEHNLYHRGGLTLEQRAGLLYFCHSAIGYGLVSVGVWRYNLPEVAPDWQRGSFQRREQLWAINRQHSLIGALLGDGNVGSEPIVSTIGLKFLYVIMSESG